MVVEAVLGAFPLVVPHGDAGHDFQVVGMNLDGFPVVGAAVEDHFLQFVHDLPGVC